MKTPLLHCCSQRRPTRHEAAAVTLLQCVTAGHAGALLHVYPASAAKPCLCLQCTLACRPGQSRAHHVTLLQVYPPIVPCFFMRAPRWTCKSTL
jgi:hypothetical protein